MKSIKLNNPLNLDLTLNSGQAFRWRKKENYWEGFINNKLCRIATENEYLYFENINESDIIKYFQLNLDICSIYNKLIEADKDIEPLIEKYYGLRILRQDTEETLYSFLCSAANSIPKIMIGIEKFCSLFSDCKVTERYCFPNTYQIINGNRDSMKSIKEIAFRGKNIYDTAYIINTDTNFFNYLKTHPYKEVKEKLISVKNIGPKIADCICLFSLDFPFVVPVDTHVRQIAEKKFNYTMSGKNINKKVYNEIQNIFTDTYGENAGIAQQFLFFNEI